VANAKLSGAVAAGLSREVGQLDFEDFVVSASLEAGRTSAGTRN
jgi:hypothetical protein